MNNNATNPVLSATKPHTQIFPWAGLVLPLYTLTIFLSAFLLFSVQPMFTKMVLPQLGGTPAVWSIAMVFFQAVLLAGYFYADVLTMWLRPRVALVVHMVVMLSAFVFLPLALPSGWGEPPASGQSIWLLGLFAAAIGLPFFAVSANGPLLQAWFARTGHPHASDPYFLYGASNIGSFASLILYALAFEPLMTLQSQTFSWMVGFGILAALILVSGLTIFNKSNAIAANPIAAAETSADSKISLKTKLHWIWLAFIPSGLLVAVTAHIAVDIASIPLLWIVPLALFLLTFVFAFARKQIISVDLLERILPILGVTVFASFFAVGSIPIPLMILLHFGFFFLGALYCHSMLASLRPHASRLTSFYFYMSLGGVLGGIFTSLIAPVAFEWRAEYTILLVAINFLSLKHLSKLPSNAFKVLIAGLVLATAINIPPLSGFIQSIDKEILVKVISALLIGAVVMRLWSQVGFAIMVIAAGGLHFAFQGHAQTVFAERSFFGVLTANIDSKNNLITMAHGTTMHGAMALDDLAIPTPLTYYHHSGGIADALFAAQKFRASQERRIGVVGLGVGSLICHRQAGEHWTQFEIDQDVIELARDAQYFRFLSSCEQPDDRMILGDARLMLQKDQPGFYDYLLIDAFSSDSIPVHLMTVESTAMYRSKLKQDGILVFHISNRHMDLKPVVAAIARANGMAVRQGEFFPPNIAGVTGSTVMILANEEAILDKALDPAKWSIAPASNVTAWTDDYSNVLAAIWRNYAKRYGLI